MDKNINQELKKQLTSTLTAAYKENFIDNQELLKMNELISFKISSFYLRQGISSKITDTRDFIFDTGNEKHVGYFLWSDDLQMADVEESRFFLLLTGLGCISGAEIVAEDETKYKLWPLLFGENTIEQVIGELKQISEKTEFAAQNPMVQLYVTTLEEMQSTEQ